MVTNKYSNVSVAMTVYNGEKYLKSQINSIISQLNENDELVISYDKSTDNTKEILNSYKYEKKVKVIEGPCTGVIDNFYNAVVNCSNDYIFLSDQDDVWINGKIKTVLARFKETNADLIIHDAIITDENLEILHKSFFIKRKCRKGIMKNILKNSYIGCCMAFKNDIKKFILPFPKNIPMHDQWIGILCEKYGKVEFLNKPLLYYRRHRSNVSSDKSENVFKMLCWRMKIIKEFLNKILYEKNF